MNAASPSPRAVEGPSGSPALTSVLWQPTRAFRGLRERPRFGVIAFLLAIASALPAGVFVSRADLAQVVIDRVQASGRKLEDLPAEAREALETRAPRALRVALPLGAVGKRLGWVTLLATLAFAALRGSRPALRWREAASAVGLACAPLVIADLAKAVLFATADLGAIDAGNPLLSNPAAWFGWSSTRDPLGAALARLDFFQLWSLALASVGLRVVADVPGSRVPHLLLAGTFGLLVAVEAVRAGRF